MIDAMRLMFFRPLFIVLSSALLLSANAAPISKFSLNPTPLPTHAQLNFDVSQGDDNFKVGEAQHTLELTPGHYVLKSEIKTTGIIAALKSYRQLQTSSGNTVNNSLQPDTFVDEVIQRNETKINRVTFDRERHQLLHSNGQMAELSTDTQDSLSVLYQLPALLKNTKSNAVSITNGRFLEISNFEIVGKETLSLPIGETKTVHLRKVRGPQMEGMEVWFAENLHWLPVKIAHYDRDGKITAVVIITHLSMSDDAQ
ncbi:MAG: hypothetical protein RLZZ144_887 [Pseudomonadota bacterium]